MKFHAVRTVIERAFICIVALCAVIAAVPSPAAPVFRTPLRPLPRASAAIALPLPAPPSFPLHQPGSASHGAAPGQTVPLRSLPALPARAAGGRFRIMSATGATVKVQTVSGCNSTLGTIYNAGCTVQWQTQNLPATGSHQDYYIDAQASTATAVGSAYAAAGGPANSQTLANNGVYVFASLNLTTNNWDAIVYVTVGSGMTLGTYADSTDKIAQSTFVASAGNSIYVNAQGLTPTDSYVVYAESTSLTGQCVFVAPPASPTPGPGLCVPSNSPGQNAPGGALNVPWQLSASLGAGTYSIVLYDLTTHTRLAQRQVTLVNSGATSSWSITPVAGGSSPNPAPAATPGTTFAYDGTQESSDNGLTFRATGLNATHQYRTVVSDPNGAVVFQQNQGSPAGGVVSANWNFTQFQSPQNYIGHTYTLSLLDTTSNSMITASAFQLLGYNVQSQFTNPTGTALAVNTGTAVSGVQFTNAGDLFYGVGNGDTISQIQYDMGSQGVTVTLDSNATSCGTGCQTEAVFDSTGQSWNVVDMQSGGGANADSTITITPTSPNQSLPMSASITVPNMTFSNPPGNHCSNGCTTYVSVLPFDGLQWSKTTQSIAANPLYITNGFHNTYSAGAHISLYGKTTGGATTLNQDAHGFVPNAPNSLLDLNQPFSSAGSQDILAYTVTNTSSAGSSPITNIQLTFPTAFTISSAAIDAASPSTWQIQACPGGTPPNVLCIQKAGSNAGIAANGGSETIYIDIPPPATSFAYTDIIGTVTNPTNFTIAADGTANVFAGQSTVVDSTALAGYSIDSTKITPLAAPATVGANTSPSLTFSVQNTPTSADAFPDYLDAVAIDVPSTNPLSNLSTSTAGWQYLGKTAAGSNTRYWFGLCPASFSAANGPATNPPPPLSPSLPNCGMATEQTNSLAPGASLTINATISVGASNVAMTAYSHGANTDAWSTGRAFTLNVTTLAATAGFTKIGTYNAPGPVSTNSTPQIGADSNSTYGNTFVYQIANLSASGSGQNVTSATITIPGTDTSGANGADSAGVPWTITSAPTLSFTGGATGCTVTSYASAQASGANGSIVIGGGSCVIPPGATVNVTFNAKAPYSPGETYMFPTKINGATAASEAWFTDTDVQVVLSASLQITVDPTGAGPGGSAPSPNCVSCLYTPSSVAIGTVLNGTSVAAKDVVLVSVYTNAALNDPWQLFISTDNNPANTGAPTNELQVAVDQTSSNQAGTGLNFDQTAYGVVPTTGNGLVLVDTGTGAKARRLPYDVVTSYQVSIQGGPITTQTANCTLTFIAK